MGELVKAFLPREKKRFQGGPPVCESELSAPVSAFSLVALPCLFSLFPSHEDGQLGEVGRSIPPPFFLRPRS